MGGYGGTDPDPLFYGKTALGTHFFKLVAERVNISGWSAKGD